jgi:uncharacterized protein (DUF924 family)
MQVFILMLEKVNEILDFWFGGDKDSPKVQLSLWWSKDPKFDELIISKFSDVHKFAASGGLKNWLDSPLSCLAYIVLIDQFSRVIYRNHKYSYAFDYLALYACNHGIEHKLDKELHPLERQFFYMPLEHSEELADQKLCLVLMKKLVKICESEYKDFVKPMNDALHYAQMHYDVIHNFSRFPHRNKILGRDNTQEELVYLSQQDSGF